jgi:hypothetical protein
VNFGQSPANQQELLGYFEQTTCLLPVVNSSPLPQLDSHTIISTLVLPILWFWA